MSWLDLLISLQIILILLLFDVSFVVKVSEEREHEDVLNNHRPHPKFGVTAVGSESTSSIVEEQECKLKLKQEILVFWGDSCKVSHILENFIFTVCSRNKRVKFKAKTPHSSYHLDLRDSLFPNRPRQARIHSGEEVVQIHEAMDECIHYAEHGRMTAGNESNSWGI